ncbi:MAG: M13 family metallopeptidase [Pseudomonadota bacterium]
MKTLLLGVAAVALLTACTTPTSEEIETATGAEVDAVVEAAVDVAEVVPTVRRKVETTSPDVWGDWGIDLAVRDTSVRPGDNFFMHVNGGWYDNFELPDDKTRYGSFDLLREKSEQQIRFIIEDLAAATPSIDTPEGKVAAMYNAYMDTDAINAAGLAPAQPYLDKIAAIETREDLARIFATPGFASPVSGFIWVDAKDPETYIPQMGLSGLGLPDRDYYTKTDETSVETRAKYVELLTFLLEQAGYDDPVTAAADVMNLETKLAATHWDRATARNRDLTYNKLTREDVLELSTAFPMAAFLDEYQLGAEQSFLVSQIPPTEEELESAGLTAETAAEKLGPGVPASLDIAATADLDTWKAYLTANFLSDFSGVLPNEIDEASFAFYGTQLSGTPEQRPRWKRAVSTVEGNLGEVLGAVFVERHFPEENKAAMDELVVNLRAAMGANLQSLTWMGDETRVKADEKLDKFNPKIGYPDKFLSYETMVIGDDALANAMAAQYWSLEDSLNRLGTDPDRDEWFMTPQTVNAYYNPSYNEIVFPAAILQPPFFNITADPAVNYGAIGGVIGHEIGHGFDDQGARFNGDGVLTNWWSETDLDAFSELGDKLVAQYNGYCPVDEGETCINGRASLGENIGDVGGLSMAYSAYQLSLDTNGDGVVSADEEAPVIDGLTGDQRFFMGWAQVWRTMYREESLRRQLLTGVHSPGEFRANGVVRNFDEWYEAFNVTEDHALYLPPEERIRIW